MTKPVFHLTVGTVLFLELLTSAPRAWAGGANSCPTAFPQIISAASNTPTNFQLMASDPDNGPNPLTYMATVPPAHGVVAIQVTTGAATYTSSPGYCGPDSFKFKVSDGLCMSNEATVSIAVCAPTQTPTLTPSATPTQTPTNTPIPIGGMCMDGTQCASTFCVDGVCCDRACAAAGQVCNAPGRAGICISIASAPAMSRTGLLSSGCMLILIAAWRLRARARQRQRAL